MTRVVDKTGRWKKVGYKIAKNHGWRAKEGNIAISIGRGDLMFEVPRDWICIPTETSLKVHEKQPPDDDIVLEVSVIYAPPRDWSDLPLPVLLQGILSNNGKPVRAEAIVQVKRPALQYAWTEYREFHEKEQREAIWRSCVARGGYLHGLITYGFWPEALELADKVWKDVLDSLQMSQFFEDPAVGPRLH
ncbi:MAG: hypothetical protein M3Y56_01970 [Armatimonadota bacterium]|nr:hypothetical protein [Armatimonadota bacterium]